jgi:hypothetical protein
MQSSQKNVACHHPALRGKSASCGSRWAIRYQSKTTSLRLGCSVLHANPVSKVVNRRMRSKRTALRCVVIILFSINALADGVSPIIHCSVRSCRTLFSTTLNCRGLAIVNPFANLIPPLIDRWIRTCWAISIGKAGRGDKKYSHNDQRSHIGTPFSLK